MEVRTQAPPPPPPPDVLIPVTVIAVLALCAYAVVVPGANVFALGCVAAILSALTALVWALRGRGSGGPGSGPAT